MITKIFEILALWIIAAISSMGYLGIVFLMGIESACIPLPSEIIMPFSGYLVHTGVFNLWLVGLAGALGCVWGSIVAYYAGMWGGRPLIERYGKYVLISLHDLERADRLFQRYGEIIVFVSRLLPIVRTFISFPAGVSRMRFGKFILYTFVGSYPWCLGLAWVGQIMGENWRHLRHYWHKFDYVIGGLILIGIAIYAWHHIKPLLTKKTPESVTTED
ncbi:DedA family protein [bacterium]|nr:DedA family protein [bacterium]MBU1936909.1 DedA family protein [bacterium]